MDVGKPKKTHRVEPVEDPVPKEKPQEPEPSKQRPPAEAPSKPVEQKGSVYTEAEASA
jgi:hypothetical protein